MSDILSDTWEWWTNLVTYQPGMALLFIGGGVLLAIGVMLWQTRNGKHRK